MHFGSIFCIAFMDLIQKKERFLMSRKTNPIQSSIWMAEQAILLVIAVATIGATLTHLVAQPWLLTPTFLKTYGTSCNPRWHPLRKKD